MVLPHLIAQELCRERNVLRRQIVHQRIDNWARQCVQLLEQRQCMVVVHRTIGRNDGIVPSRELDQLPAVIPECRQVGTWGSSDRRDKCFDLVVDGREIDVTTPVERWAKHSVYLVADEGSVTS